jgi:hypothetical protein
VVAIVSIKVGETGDEDTRHGKVALKFAQALVAGEYRLAHGLLAEVLRLQLTPRDLQELFEEMIEYWNGELPNYIEVNIVDYSEEEVQVYVPICMDGNGEAVTVIVTEIDGQLLIREIDWGRP